MDIFGFNCLFMFVTKLEEIVLNYKVFFVMNSFTLSFVFHYLLHYRMTFIFCRINNHFSFMRFDKSNQKSCCWIQGPQNFFNDSFLKNYFGIIVYLCFIRKETDAFSPAIHLFIFNYLYIFNYLCCLSIGFNYF